MLKKAVLLGVCVFAAVGLTGCPGTACFGIDTCQLQGTWEATVTVGSTTTVIHRMVIKDDTFQYTTLGGGGFEGTFSIAALKDPKQIDFSITRTLGLISISYNPPKTRYGIYDVSKDTLTVQFGGETQRPIAFDNDEAITMARVSTD